MSGFEANPEMARHEGWRVYAPVPKAGQIGEPVKREDPAETPTPVPEPIKRPAPEREPVPA